MINLEDYTKYQQKLITQALDYYDFTLEDVDDIYLYNSKIEFIEQVMPDYDSNMSEYLDDDILYEDAKKDLYVYESEYDDIVELIIK